MRLFMREQSLGKPLSINNPYSAHKAANPNRYPLREDVRGLLPSLGGIEKKYGPTKVHLQVYDGSSRCFAHRHSKLNSSRNMSRSPLVLYDESGERCFSRNHFFRSICYSICSGPIVHQQKSARIAYVIRVHDACGDSNRGNFGIGKGS